MLLKIKCNSLIKHFCLDVALVCVSLWTVEVKARLRATVQEADKLNINITSGLCLLYGPLTCGNLSNICLHN